MLVMLYSGTLNELFIHCFRTARKYSPDSKIILFTDFTPEERKKLQPFGVSFRNIRKIDYHKKQVSLKIEMLRFLDVKYNDLIIVSDLDVIFQADPFVVFENEFDVFFTSRHYEYHYPINAGIWGFRVNQNSRRFLKFYIKQMYARSWRMMRDFGNKFGRYPLGPGWYLDQDFLCTVFENLGDLPKEINGVRFYDAGYKFNFCPSFDIFGEIAVQELKSKIGNPDYKILHLKAELKQLLDSTELSVKDHVNWPPSESH